MYFMLTNCLKRWEREATVKTDSSVSPVFEFIQNCTSIAGWDYHFLLFRCVYSVVLHRSEEDDLSKGNHLAENEPDVDHLNVGGGGQALHLADEDGRHHQHGRQVHAQGCLEEEGLEEGGCEGDGNEKKRWKIGRHHLPGDLSPKHNHHLDPIFLAPLEFPIND